MADRHAGLLRRLHDHAPSSTQIIGFLALLVSGAILLLFAGVTLAAAVLGLILLYPVILLTSPIWVPAGAALVVAGGGLLLAIAAAAGATWGYKYLRGRQPPGSERVDYARGRIADTAGQVKDYALEYGGYLQRRVKDAAPGA